MKVEELATKTILTRVTGYLVGVSSHSLQPYQGCSFGRSLCGVSCYVQHNTWIAKGRSWGHFLGVKKNAAECYVRELDRERRWARVRHGRFSIFMSSATDPYLPQETKYRVTRAVLEAMLESPPDLLILQTHSATIIDDLEILDRLADRTELRIHLSIESDRDTLEGLPPPAHSVKNRFEAASRLSRSGHCVVITVSPLLPIEEPEAFFTRIGEVASAMVIDHFIEGDGSPDGSRTRRTLLPAAIAKVLPEALTLDYRDRMIEIARSILPGRVGVSREGFAGRFR